MNKPSMQIGLGIALGAGIGAAFAVALGTGGVWLAVGIAVGVAIGAAMSRNSASHKKSEPNAIAIADQHLLEKKQKENGDKVSEWMRKAELAVDKKQDDLARVALERVESYRDLSDGFGQQVTDQKAQVENLKTALRQLEQKLTEAQAKADLLIAQHRRARAVGKASDAKLAIGDNSKAATFDRMKRKVAHTEAMSQAKSEIAADNVEERLAALEKEDRIEQLLVELKAKRGA